MIPFDLEKAKKGHTVRTRTGKKAIFIAHLQGGQPAPLVFDICRTWPKLTGGFEDVPSEHGKPENYFLNGKWDGVHDNDLDLFIEY